MAPQGVERKLTAILSADVKGYSRLMGDEEVATIRTLTAYREVMVSLIQQHRGRVVDTVGDNLLAEFASVVDAVQCAVEVQKALKSRNAELPDPRKMEFRIGINLGDVVVEGERIYGDGVNIAARVEGLAEGGGVCISRTAFDQVKNKLALGYEFLGEHTVKNIAEPVRVYRVLMDPQAAGRVIGETRPPIARMVLADVRARPWRWGALAVVVLLVAGAGAAAIWNLYLRPAPPPVEVASKEKVPFPLPDKPSIAVLAFDNLSGDPEQEDFSDGIAENIITQLSKSHSLFVIARSSSFTYKGKPAKVQQVGEELGVRYVLEGSVQKAGDRVRITAQLIDAAAGRHLWADQYDRELKDLFAVQDEITRKVVTEVGATLTEGEMQRVLHQSTQNVEALTYYQRALAEFRRFNKEANLQSRELNEKAIELDPDFSLAYSLLAWTYAWPVRAGLSKSPAEDIKHAEELLDTALALDASNTDAHNELGFLYMLKRQYDKAIEQGERATSLAPNFADAYAIMAISLVYAGKPEEAIVATRKAMRLAPFYPRWYPATLGKAYYLTGQYEQAIAATKEFLTYFPNAERTRAFLAAIYIASGREEEARAEAQDLLRKNPTFSLKQLAKGEPFRDRAEVERLLALARKAGLSE